MEQIKTSAEGQENENLEQFEATPREQLVEMIKAVSTPEEVANLTETDIDMALNVAKRKLAAAPGATAIEDAVIGGVIARREALSVLGETSFDTVVKNKKGQVVATGADRSDAMKKAEDLL